MASYGHALDAAACGGFLAYWAATLGQWRWRRWLGLGGLLGLAMLIRTQDLALGVVVLVEVVSQLAGELRRRDFDRSSALPSGSAARSGEAGPVDRRRAARWVLGGAVVLAVALVVFVPQLAYWRAVYGQWFGLPQGAKYTRLGSPMILELLYSPRNGWLSSHPVAYLGVIGLACLPRRARVVAIGFALAIGVQVYLNSTILDWWAMNSFGQRRMCSMTLPLVVGLAALVWRAGQIRRIPRWAGHALAIAVLGSMVAWNVWRVRALRGGHAPSGELEPACCGRAPGPLRGAIRAIYDLVGDPFEFPANALYAWHHGVDLRRWDTSVGYYPLVPPARTLTDGTMQYEHGAWRIGYPKAEPYLVGDWGDPEGDASGNSFRWTRAASVRAIVPNLMPEPQRYTLHVAPGGSQEVTLRWDGEVVAHQTLAGGWNWVTFQLDAPSVGDHDLDIETVPAPFPPTTGWPREDRPVGIAVGLLEIEFIR
jgi:hypothetical protein